MKATKTFKGNGFETKYSHSVFERSQARGRTVLKPVTLLGVIAPWDKSFGGGLESIYKLVSYGGGEYFIVADSKWREILSRYCWEEVKVVGLLNVSNMTLIPQKVYPKGPSGSKEDVVDLVERKSGALVRRLIKNLNDLIVVPAAAGFVLEEVR